MASTSIRLAVLLGVFAACGSAGAQSNFGAQEPSVDAIVEQLRSKSGADGAVDTGRTRALRPGAAAASTAAPAQKASISMQIQFGFNSSQIEGGSLQTMENLALALASPELQDRNFTIIGHTDGVGSADYNRRLSQARARSVRDFLVQRGVAGARLNTQGMGFDSLLNPADPAAAENRRVEIVAISQ
ncbi:OmpA family protein [Pseudoxanthomonas suwonensis]|uniref:OmpA family protein n=1 Tax=Pseudoxanthomonas suwonensis TaxID=314722 RepID=UPI000A9EF56F|nr:OmpA family protein [Pseudoxanthomonas suwonensis]